MAEGVVSVALETFRDLLLEEARFLFGVGDEVRALQRQLTEMKCLLKDADARQHESESVRHWIAEIRDLAYRAEDTIETYAVNVSLKRAPSPGLKKLLRRFCCILDKLCSVHRIGNEVLRIKSDLEAVSKSMQEFGIKSIIQGESSSANDNKQWKRKTFPHFKTEDCFVGKDDELKQIVSLLVSDDHQHHRVVSVWGMGGLGKTTIARKAYHHEDTQRHFQSFAWVCIGQQCNIKSVLEDVLKQLNPLKSNAASSLSDTELIEELCKIQNAKRCIIVVDDLWKIDDWDGMKHAFLVGGLKSKILVTTRKEKVAEIGFPHRLGRLSMASGLELLKMKVFPGNHVSGFACDEKVLEELGKEMVRKCDFLPLTICLLGGVLSKRKSIRGWELVKENINAHLYKGDGIADDENEIHAMLKLSYEDLPYYLKSCFLYLGLYKEDESIPASDLYRRWIAQGMISHYNGDDESLLVSAERYLNELASRSIVQVQVLDEEAKSGEKYSWCKLHDSVRVLCLSMGEKEGFGLKSLTYQDGNLVRGSLSGVKTRHLALHFEGENEGKIHGSEFAITNDEDACKHVRSLLLDVEKKTDFLHIDIHIQVFKVLRVLHFLRLKFQERKLPEEIGDLIHLRYLRFDDCDFDELPSSIGNLNYLQTLHLASWNIRVPNVFKKLLQLRHLILPDYGDDVVRNFPLELDEGLDDLETLTGFDNLLHQLRSIIRLKNLQTLAATLHDNESLSAMIDSVVTSWSKLKTCTLYIMKDFDFTSTEEGLMVMRKVLTCPKLHQLGIYVEIGKRLDDCILQVSSARIVRLYLWECKITNDPMDILGKLPALNELFLWEGSILVEEIVCPAFSFPCLTRLVMEKLPNLREWRIEKGAMSLLSEIEINNCPNLMALPDGFRFIYALQKLTIKEMPTLGKRILASKEDGSQGEDFDKVHHVPSIIINN